MRRFAIVMVLVAFIFSSGGQWAVLQCVAWGSMIREYSQMVPIGAAVKMTFSGQYPCPICKAIAERKESENNKLVVLVLHEKPVQAPELSYQPRMIAPEPQIFFSRDMVLQSHLETPPTPPPRFA